MFEFRKRIFTKEKEIVDIIRIPNSFEDARTVSTDNADAELAYSGICQRHVNRILSMAGILLKFLTCSNNFQNEEIII